LGYIENRVIERLQTNDSTYSEKFNLGNRIKYIHIYVGKINLSTTASAEHYTRQSFIPYTKLENFLKENTIALEREGYSLARLKNITKKKETLYLANSNSNQKNKDD
jgi:hypothetical protein